MRQGSQDAACAEIVRDPSSSTRLRMTGLLLAEARIHAQFRLVHRSVPATLGSCNARWSSPSTMSRPPRGRRSTECFRSSRRLGVPFCSLLVVPDYHHLGRSLGEPGFTEWLRGLAALGHEIVIHGFYHERARGVGESNRQEFVTRIYTADEGEFYDLDYAEAADRLCDAKREFF